MENRQNTTSRSLRSDWRGRLRSLTGTRTRGGRDYYDYNLLAVVILLTCFGLVMLYSTSAYEAAVDYQNDMYFFRKQALISAASVVALVGFSQIDYHFYARFAAPLYWVSIVLLFMTKIVGRTINGARRWIYIGPISFQPAEQAKLAIILFLPTVIIKAGGQMKNLKDPLITLFYGGLSSFFTFYFTENLSTAIIIAGITVIMIFIVHRDTRRMLIIGFGGVILVAAAVAVILNRVSTDTESFRLRRILVWMHPEQYAEEGGYQVMQGLYAIGSGGFFGKGLGNSTQKLGAQPEAHNDMIFSIICEELGLFGALLVVMLFVFLLSRLYVIARSAPDLLGSLIVTGIFIHIALQVVLNIAVVINMIPTTGITLPFVSYGGTSILFLMLEMMVALSVSRQAGR